MARKITSTEKVLIGIAFAIILFLAFSLISSGEGTPGINTYKVTCDIQLKNPVLQNVQIVSYLCSYEKVIFCNPFSMALAFFPDRGNVKLIVDGKATVKPYEISELATETYTLSVCVTGAGTKPVDMQVFDDESQLIAERTTSIVIS